MDSIKDVLQKFNPLEDKYISREFQAYGVYVAEKLDDMRHKSLYIKLSKQLPRPAIEKALRFVADSGARRKGALFMWKLKEMGSLGQIEGKGEKGKRPAGKDGNAEQKVQVGARKKVSKKVKDSSVEQLELTG